MLSPPIARQRGCLTIAFEGEDEALRIASMHPAAQLGEACGWTVELIPMDFYQGQ